MKKTIISLIVLVVLSSVSYAEDLEDWPNMFLDGDDLEAKIVVGNKASSSDVLLQIDLLNFFADSVTSTTGVGVLASDVTDLEQNLILIGSPCANDIIADILDVDEDDCHRFIEDGTAIIKVIDEGDYVYLLASGNSDSGTKEAVDVLKDYDDYDLAGDEFTLGVEDSEYITKEEGEVIVVGELPPVVNVTDELMKKIEENKAKEEEEPVVCIQDVKDCPDGSYVSRMPPDCEFIECPVVIEEPEPAVEEQESFFEILIDWFKSLF